jgi:hypothetical protein
MPVNRPDARYRLTETEKDQVRGEIHAQLIALARTRQVVTYSQFCDRLSFALHPHSFVFAHLLRQVCRDAEADGEGVLCALVVSKTTGMPGAGYFNRAFTPEQTADLRAAWEAERDAVFARWAAS